jgi:hypothetical protein
MHIQQTRMSVKLYSRELCSTIDTFQNTKTEYIYLGGFAQQRRAHPPRHSVSSINLRVEVLRQTSP